MDSFTRNTFTPCLLATGVGSMPHADVAEACALITRTLPESPFWPQLPKHSPLEDMNVQVSPGFPFLKIDEEKGVLEFDAGRDEAQELEKVYRAFLGDEPLPLPSSYAGGFEGMLRALQGKAGDLRFFKGQMVGPVTFGLGIKDADGKDVIHNDVVFDGLLKALILRGRRLIQAMNTVCPRVVFFLDEPALAGY
ncbi:MAG TPA: hypothetical protein VLS90_07010, partial [Thermodesulfobacteriota bacterium]|nr:hypothetical protein [Thermodesulfobacteriota bacterium]